MNIWIVKNIHFGYKYTTNKEIRKIILDYFNNFLINTLNKKGTKDDIFVVSGGLFSNTNPSIIAISDAHNIINKISKIMNVKLISSYDDMRKFDGEDYTTLNLLNNIDNVDIISLKDEIKLCDGLIISSDKDYATINGNRIKIPDIIQFENNQNNKIGVLIYNTLNKKFIIFSNKYSPKHVTYEINNFEDFKKIKNDNNYKHLIIDDKLSNENKSLLNIEIFKIRPVSVKIKNKKIIKNNKEVKDFNIVNTIYKTIENDNKLKEQFRRILQISKDR